MCKEVGGMVHNGGTRESSNQVALPRPGKCPTARTDQYPTRAVTSRGELNHSNVSYSRFWCPQPCKLLTSCG
uniref:Uncharacterized protein n=1 Tax=Oryza meridionalis TaxID=40149 RepID=A0A0E0C2G3_9ORYZ